MNICKSLLKRTGIIAGSIILIPLLAVILVGIVGLLLPFCIGAGIIAAVTMSNDELDDCFKVEVNNTDPIFD